MALTDQVLMPGSDYQAICDATRNLTGKTETLKSGDISTELETVTPQGETWVLGLVPSSSSGATGTFSTIFTSSYYSNMIFYGIKCYAQTNGYKIEFYTNSEKTSTILPYSNGWEDDNIRKLTFKNPPTDAKFLSWLNVWRGEKQNTDLAVCLEDSITIHNTPRVYTPEHPYDGTKKLNITISPTTQATPSISVNADGLITASVTQSAGYVTAGTKSATQQLPIQAAKTVTPSDTQQTAVASGKYTTGAVTVKAVPTEMKVADLSMVSGNQVISNTSGKYMTSVTIKKPSTLIPSNIKKGVDIGGVVGAIPEIDATNLLDGVLTSNGSIGIAGDEVKLGVYLNLDPSATLAEGHMILPELGSVVKSVTVPTEEKTITPTWTSSSSSPSYSPTSGKLIRRVVVDKPVGLIPSNIKNGAYVGGVVGTYGGGVDLPFTKLTTVSTDNGILSFSFTGYYNTIIAKRSGTNDVLTAVFGNNLKASFSIGSSGEVLSTSAGFSYNQVGNKFNVTWNICESSGSVWYEGTYDIYGCSNG